MAHQVSDLKIVAYGDGVRASWTRSKNLTSLENYNVTWDYYDKSGRIHTNVATDTVEPPQVISDYEVPSDATKIRVGVKPVSKKNSDGKKYWTGTTVYKSFSVSNVKPDAPASVTATYNEVTPSTLVARATFATGATRNVDAVQFRLYTDKTGNISTKTVTYSTHTNTESYKFSVSAGRTYWVKARSVNWLDKKHKSANYSSWVTIESGVLTAPSEPLKLRYTPVNIKDQGYDKRVVRLKWDKVDNAWPESDTVNKGYTIEYSVGNKDFDNYSDSDVVSVDSNVNHYDLDGIAGNVYVRVRANNGSQVEHGPWSKILLVRMGLKPDPPTIWTDKQVVTTNESFNLYWVHNTVDGTSWTHAAIGIRDLDNDITAVRVVENAKDGDTDQTGHLTIDFSNLEGFHNYVNSDPITSFDPMTSPRLSINVATMGLVLYTDPSEPSERDHDYSDISETIEMEYREVPSYELTSSIVDNVLTSMPITFAYSSMYNYGRTATIEITADEPYDYVDPFGEPVHIADSQVIFRKQVAIENNPDHTAAWSIDPSEVQLQNGISYTITTNISFTNGTTSSDSVSFETAFPEFETYIDAAIIYDENSLGCYIHPMCFVNDTSLNVAAIESLITALVEGLMVTPMGSLGNLADVYLSVYRRMPDGEFMALAERIDDAQTVVFDPHPTLKNMCYRIVTTNKTTGASEHADVTIDDVIERAILIQWKEDYEQEMIPSDEEDEWPSTEYVGKLLRLPYNIKIQESHDMEVHSVNYIGRKHPVTYYGTHTNEIATWSTEIPKYDTNTISLLRELSVYPSDVYVREPNGNGFWANVKVDYSIDYDSLIVPVTFNITRVEGGA